MNVFCRIMLKNKLIATCISIDIMASDLMKITDLRSQLTTIEGKVENEDLEVVAHIIKWVLFILGAFSSGCMCL